MSEPNPPEASPSSLSGASSTPVSKEQPSKTLEKIIQEKAPEVLATIPEGQRLKLAKVTIEETRISMRSGMLPEPSELAAYNAIIPNGADRIMKMAEAQSAHRIQIEKSVVQSQQSQEKRGQVFGLIIALFFGGAALYAAVNGQATFASIIGGTTLVSLVGVFVFAKQSAQKELSDKRKQNMPAPGSPPSSGQASSKQNKRRK